MTPKAHRTPKAAPGPHAGRRFTPEEAEDLLLGAEVEGGELIPQGSNYAFAVQLKSGGVAFYGVYKPASGERPLWDFPYGTLHRRERCSFLVSRFLGWGFVPPTVIRGGPHGEGSMQLYIPPADNSSYFTLREEGRPELPLVAAFDLIVNNTDRKGGHCFKGLDGRVWAIDHGLTFHSGPKLRTVIWDFAGQRLPGGPVEDLRRLACALEDAAGPLRRELESLLDPGEVDTFRRRVRAFAQDPKFPTPQEYRSVPWPLL
ncbi:MAG: SCO1664 family protein [Candidatus Tectomicrobia bacterium]|nr:SCO1664 family protein [Candidatus Tectomicrobia bacterium]